VAKGVSAAEALFDAIIAPDSAAGSEFLRIVADGLLRAMRPREGERWLDVGLGHSEVQHLLHELLGETGTVVGAVGDLAHAPGAGGSGRFDAVCCSLVLPLLADAAHAVLHWPDLLKPGGRIGVSLLGPPDPHWLDVCAAFDEFVHPSLRRPRNAAPGGALAAPGALDHLLEAAGLVDVHHHTDDLVLEFASTDAWEAFTQTTGERSMWAAVPAAEQADVRRRVVDRLHVLADADGTITFRQSVHYTVGRRPR